MGFSTVPCNEFVEVLGSKAPVPGGGGASALVGAVGTALGNMVGALTVGKKKYADVEEEMKELMAKATTLQDELLHLIERDAEVFEPLSKAYGMPRETEEEKAEKARERGEHAGNAGYLPAGNGDGGAGSDHSRQRAEKSRGETSADGTGTVCLADCWWWCD